MVTLQGACWVSGGSAAYAAGGRFGGGGFHGGSIGNAGHVATLPYVPGAYYGYGYEIGPTTVEGDEGPTGGGTSAPTAYSGTGGGPPQELQDGRGVYVPRGSGSGEGPSWDSDWWAQDPRAGGQTVTGHAGDLEVGTVVTSLPMDREMVIAEGVTYYYLEGTFFRATDAGYQIVAPPIGIEIRHLPSSAEMVEVGGKQYLLHDDTYYQALYSGSGIVYKVVEDPSS